MASTLLTMLVVAGAFFAVLVVAGTFLTILMALAFVLFVSINNVYFVREEVTILSYYLFYLIHAQEFSTILGNMECNGRAALGFIGR